MSVPVAVWQLCELLYTCYLQADHRDQKIDWPRPNSFRRPCKGPYRRHIVPILLNAPWLAVGTPPPLSKVRFRVRSGSPPIILGYDTIRYEMLF